MIDAEELYYKLRRVTEQTGAFIPDEADEVLADFANAVAEASNQ